MPEGMIDIRSSDPIHSPYPLKNIRGVVHWRNGIVITGAEDGDLCLVDFVAGKVIFSMVYYLACDLQRNITVQYFCRSFRFS